MNKEDLHSFLLYLLLIVVYIILISTDIRLKAFDFTAISAIVVLAPFIIIAFPYISQKIIDSVVNENQNVTEKAGMSDRNSLIISLIVTTTVILSSICAGGILNTSGEIITTVINSNSHSGIKNISNL